MTAERSDARVGPTSVTKRTRRAGGSACEPRERPYATPGGLLVRRAVVIAAACLVVVLLAVGATGNVVLARARDDPLERVDAIIVLGGEHDGREDYGVELALDGVAPTVVLSNPYPVTDPVMSRLCRPGSTRVEVICARPEPPTTRGEALFTRDLARERGWTTVLVLTWRYHLPRARFIFERCFSAVPGAVIARAVPRHYDYSWVDWEFTYFYQFGGLAKALVQGGCSR